MKLNCIKWCLILTLLLVSWVITAQTTLTVTSNVSGTAIPNLTGLRSLRDCINQANSSTSNILTIRFAVTSIILSSPITVNRVGGRSLDIQGNATITIRGSGTRQHDGLVIKTATTVSGVQFENFNQAINAEENCTLGSAGNTGSNVFLNNNFAIYSTETVNIDNCFIGTNRTRTAVNGNTNGVVVNTGGVSSEAVYISNTTICGSQNFGLLLAIATGGQSEISNCTIGMNQAGYGNGITGLDIQSGDFLIQNNSFSNNGKAISASGRNIELRNNSFVCNANTSVFTYNNPYPQPTNINYTYNHAGQVVISGTTAAAGDAIEIYESNAAACNNTTLCQGIRRARVIATDQRTWSATIRPSADRRFFVNASLVGREPIIGGPPPESLLTFPGRTSLFTTCQTPLCPTLIGDLVKVSDVTCFGNNDGRARINVQQGTNGTFEYRIIQTDISPAVQTQAYKALTTFDTVRILKKGQFQANIRNTLTGCIYNSTVVTINQPTAPLTLSNCREVSPTLSPASSDGRGEITISGGTPPYTVSYRRTGGAVVTLTPNINSASVVGLPNLAAGNYVVTVTDGKYNVNLKSGCIETCNFTITTPQCTAIKATIVSVTHPLCFDSLGSFRVKCVDIAANLPLILTISNSLGTVSTRTINRDGFPADSIFTISNLRAETYTITLSSRNGTCTFTTNTTLTQPTKLDILCDTVIHVARAGEATGKAEVITSGGSTPYRLSLSGAINRSNFASVPSAFITTSIDNLIKGSYVATVIDNNRCMDTCRFIITEPDCRGFRLLADADSVKCFGETNGRIALSVERGDSNYVFQWNKDGIGNQAVLNNLAVGTYRATVTDGRNCRDSIQVIISTPSVLRASTTVDSIRAPGGTGTISITALGGTPDYDVELILNNVPRTLTRRTGNTFVFANLGKGTYSYTVTDANGCDTTGTITLNDLLCNINIDARADSVLCKNGADGRIATTVTNGVAPLTYTWKNGVSNTSTARGLRADTYWVAVSDSRSCVDSAYVTVYEPDSMSAIATKTDVTRIAGTDGTIRVLIRGGTPAYIVRIGTDTLAVRESANSFIFNNLKKGIYSINIIDAKGCTDRKTIEINEPTCNLTVNPQSDSVRCFGGSDGRIALNIGNGIPPLSIRWSGGIPNDVATAENLRIGSYTASIRDGRGCTLTTDPIVVAQPTRLASTFTTTKTSRADSQDATIRVVVSGGTQPYRVQLGATTATVINATTFRFTGLAVGRYAYTVTDDNGCTTSDSVSIEGPICTITLNGQADSVRCQGTATGRIVLTATNATNPLVFNWSPNTNNTTNIASNLNAGTYYATVTDANGCMAYDTIQVFEPTALNSTATPTHITVVGQTGAIQVVVSGGTQPYVSAKIGTTNATIVNAITFNFAGLAAGTYTYIVTDSKGCTSEKTVTINPLNCNLTLTSQRVDSVTCNGTATGRITLATTGGIPPLSINWSQASIGNTLTANDLAAGSYTATATDASRCTSSVTVQVFEPTALTSTATPTHITQVGQTGAIQVVVAGGTQPYVSAKIGIVNATVVNATTFNFTGLAAGTYTYIVTDSKGCTSEKTVTINPLNCNLTLTSQRVDSVTCNGTSTGRITLATTGGTPPLSINWSQASIGNTLTANNLAAGTYTATVTDASRCTTSVTVQVFEPIALTSTATPTHITQVGQTGAIQVVVAGGTQPYVSVRIGTANATIVNATTFNFTGLAAGTYTYIVTDSKGCTNEKTVTINPLNCNLTLTSQRVDSVTCNGTATGRITLATTGGIPPLSINWSQASIGNTLTANNLAAGTYTATVTDASRCTTSVTVQVFEPAALTSTATATHITQVGQTGAIQVVVAGGTRPYVSAKIGTANATVVNATTFNFYNLAAGTYTYIVTDSKGCTSEKAVVINSLNCAITVQISRARAVSCFGSTDGAINLTVTNAQNPQFIWSNGSVTQNLTNVAAGTYKVTVTDTQNCTQVAEITLTQPTEIPPPTIISILRDSLCSGADLTITTPASALNPVQYVWQTPTGTVTTPTPSLIIRNVNASHSGLYTLKLAVNTCQSAATPSLRVTVLAVPTQVAFAGADKLECGGGASSTINAQAIASQHVTGSWASLDGARIAQANFNNTTVSDLKTGNNRFVWTLTSSVCGLIGRDTMSIFVEKTPVAVERQFNLGGSDGSILINLKEVVKDSSAFKFSTTAPNAAIDGNRFMLFKRGDFKDAQVIEIPYQVCAERCSNLCTSSKLFINIAQLIVPTDSVRVDKVLVINSSTTTYLRIENLERYENNEFLVVDRWGSPVFGPTKYIKDTPDHAWDGTKNGKTLPNGAYYYVLKYNKTKDQRAIERGAIYLVEGL